MKKIMLAKFSAFTFICLLSVSAVYAQRKRPAPVQKAKPIVFAVTDAGTRIEPIGLIDKGELAPASGGDDEPAKLLKFTKTYYKPGAVYKLIFGGVDAGTVTVKSSNPNTDFLKNTATVAVFSAKAKLKEPVMALATNENVKKGTGFRRLPTAAERAEIESLVRAEFIKNKVSANAAKNLKYQNLTALDVNSDGKAEMVGSFWVETSATERALLFFIAEKSANGKYIFGISEFSTIKQEDVMSGEIKSVDEGIYHELLLDAMEYDGDTTAEIFTYASSFEGASFNVYSRREGKWVKAFEGSNYHGAY